MSFHDGTFSFTAALREFSHSDNGSDCEVEIRLEKHAGFDVFANTAPMQPKGEPLLIPTTFNVLIHHMEQSSGLTLGRELVVDRRAYTFIIVTGVSDWGWDESGCCTGFISLCDGTATMYLEESSIKESFFGREEPQLASIWRFEFTLEMCETLGSQANTTNEKFTLLRIPQPATGEGDPDLEVWTKSLRNMYATLQEHWMKCKEYYYKYCHRPLIDNIPQFDTPYHFLPLTAEQYKNDLIVQLLPYHSPSDVSDDDEEEEEEDGPKDLSYCQCIKYHQIDVAHRIAAITYTGTLLESGNHLVMYHLHSLDYHPNTKEIENLSNIGNSFLVPLPPTTTITVSTHKAEAENFQHFLRAIQPKKEPKHVSMKQIWAGASDPTPKQEPHENARHIAIVNAFAEQKVINLELREHVGAHGEFKSKVIDDMQQLLLTYQPHHNTMKKLLLSPFPRSVETTAILNNTKGLPQDLVEQVDSGVLKYLNKLVSVYPNLVSKVNYTKLYGDDEGDEQNENTNNNNNINNNNADNTQQQHNNDTTDRADAPQRFPTREEELKQQYKECQHEAFQQFTLQLLNAAEHHSAQKQQSINMSPVTSIFIEDMTTVLAQQMKCFQQSVALNYHHDTNIISSSTFNTIYNKVPRRRHHNLFFNHPNAYHSVLMRDLWQKQLPHTFEQIALDFVPPSSPDETSSDTSLLPPTMKTSTDTESQLASNVVLENNDNIAIEQQNVNNNLSNHLSIPSLTVPYITAINNQHYSTTTPSLSLLNDLRRVQHQFALLQEQYFVSQQHLATHTTMLVDVEAQLIKEQEKNIALTQHVKNEEERHEKEVQRLQEKHNEEIAFLKQQLILAQQQNHGSPNQ